MSRPKIMVFKLKDLQIPIIMLLVALAVFTYFMFSNKNATETFSPSNSYQDGQYLANISLADADLDLVVDVADHKISSVSFSNFDDNEKAVYQDLDANISFINDYVTSTQSLELPTTDTLSTSTTLLMNAVKVALSDDKNAALTTTYQSPLLEQLSNVDASAVPTDETLSTEVSNEEGVTEEQASQAETTSTDEATETSEDAVNQD